MKKIGRNNKGFSLIEVLVAASIVAGVGVSVVNLGLLGSKDRVTQNLARSANRARQNVEAALKNPTAWDITVAQEGNAEPFRCFDPNVKTGCSLNAGSPDGYYNFVIHGVNNEKLTFDQADPTTRIPTNTESCDVNVPENSEQCPLRYLAKWKPVCTNGVGYPCENAQVEIQLTLVNDFPAQAPFNPNLYNFKIMRNFVDTSVPDACRLLNGIYNVKTGKCVPKYAGQACASPYQVVTSVDSSGNITCGPLYHGTCSPTTQMVTGFNVTGAVTCSAQPGTPGACNANCIGQWSACDASIPQYGSPFPGVPGDIITGQQTYTIITPAGAGGTACAYPAGATQFCHAPQASPTNCVGNWGACSATCGGGTRIFSVTTPAQNGGAACTNSDGDQSACNTHTCGTKQDCVGSWGSCNKDTGVETYSITTPAQNGGAACSVAAGAVRNCLVNCEGSWSGCAGTPPNAHKVFNVTTTPKNGGAVCSYPNGATDSVGCNATIGQCRSVGCFVAGTKITMADGSLKNIEDVGAGEKVLSFDERTKTQRVDVVSKPLMHSSRQQELHHFVMSDGSKVTSNDEHPFYVVEKDNWFRATDINAFFKKGETITFLNKENKKIHIKNIRIEYKDVPVYNLEIKGIAEHDEKYGAWGLGHNYYANGILVHNKLAPDWGDPCEGIQCTEVDPVGPGNVCPGGTVLVGGTCLSTNRCKANETFQIFLVNGMQRAYCCPGATKQVQCTAMMCNSGNGSDCTRFMDGTWETNMTYSCTGDDGNGGVNLCSLEGCAQPVDCEGYWGTCGGNGKETYHITRAAQGAGAACPATAGQTRDCAATCSKFYCYGNRNYSCARHSDGTATRNGPSGSCSNNIGIANPCTQNFCGNPTTGCCTGAWTLDANVGMCVQNAVSNNGSYTCPSGGSLGIDGTKCVQAVECEIEF